MKARPLCSIPGCERPATRRGWCQLHYRRWWRHGDPLHVARAPAQVGELLAKVGVTYRQYDHWSRCGFVDGFERSPGSGRPRTVGATEDQIARLRALAEASRIKRMPLDELADMIQKKQKAASR